MKPKDKIGREINVGDCIIFADKVLARSCLRFGRVLEIDRKESRTTPWRIRVFSVSDTWSSTPRLMSKPGVMQHPDRMLVLDETQVPGLYWNLLQNVGNS